MIELTRGNLLEAKVEALVNTVNTAGVMGKGIALQFRKAFPDNYEAYRTECTAGRLQPGRMFIFETGSLVGPGYVINFPTKRHWRQPSRYEDIEGGLRALVQEVQRRGIRSIALPPLGCGNGGLDWHRVRPMIEAAFQELPEVRVLLYEPAGALPPERMVNRTRRPEMTSGRAAILALMRRYLVPGYDYTLSLLEVQKLAYFLQQAGQPLRLQYEAGHYGPYADNLRLVLDLVEGHFISGYGDGSNKPETPIRLLPGAAEEAEAKLASDAASQARLERVARLIEGFETPLGMEMLSTVHWVCTQGKASQNDPASAIRAVHEWNTRKAALMKPEHIQVAWQRLREHSWL